MSLSAQHSQPQVKPTQPQHDERVRTRLSLLRTTLRRSESLVVEQVGESEGGEGEEGEREEEVEVEEEVGEVEGGRLGSVEIWGSSVGREEVVEDDVESGESGSSVRVGVDEEDGDLSTRPQLVSFELVAALER